MSSTLLKGDKLTTNYPGWASGAHHGIIVAICVVLRSSVVMFIGGNEFQNQIRPKPVTISSQVVTGKKLSVFVGAGE